MFSNSYISLDNKQHHFNQKEILCPINKADNAHPCGQRDGRECFLYWPRKVGLSLNSVQRQLNGNTIVLSDKFRRERGLLFTTREFFSISRNKQTNNSKNSMIWLRNTSAYFSDFQRLLWGWLPLKSSEGLRVNSRQLLPVLTWKQISRFCYFSSLFLVALDFCFYNFWLNFKFYQNLFQWLCILNWYV